MLDFFLNDFYVCNDLLNTPVREIEFCVLDFETTGLYPYNGDRIVEAGIVRIQADKFLGNYETLINPCIPLSEEVTRINHITNDMVKNAPLMESKIDEIMAFITNSVIAGHNLSFDISFLNYQLQKMNRPKVNLWLVDTLKVSKELLPNLERYTLQQITSALKIRQRESHRALPDAKAAAKLLQVLMQKLPPGSTLQALQAYKIQ
ncbi:MAG: 3'-5' exonuclease [Candidatus Aureabacteria bacterium]|nr:3'-5' exonuclease [Candidatus Auribacterota bacterium]